MKKLNLSILLTISLLVNNLAYSQTTVVSYTDFNSWTRNYNGGDSNGTTMAAYLRQTSDGGCAYALFTSPVFSTAGYENLNISADIINSNSRTFIRIEYSPDGGTNWYPLGSSAEGTNWYNSTSGCDSANSGHEGWEGNMNLTAKVNCLNSSLSNNPNARLRVYIDMWNDGGSAILDNLIIEGSAVTTEDLSSGPGGITSGLKMWLRTDTEIPFFADGASVDTWDDKIKNNSSFAENASDSPTFYNNITENINFNPVLGFDGTQSLRSCAGLYTQDIFVVAQPSSTVSSASSAAYIVGIDDNATTYPAVDISGIHFGDTGTKFTNEVVSYNLETSTAGYAVAQTGTATYNNVSILNAGNNASANGMNLYANGNLLSTSQVNTGSFKNLSDTKYWLGRGESTTANYAGKIMEVISFSNRLSDIDRQKVETYLGIKYGVTLGVNGTSKNYLDSGNNVIWNATDAATGGNFNYDVFGIGRDDSATLNQKQSKSINSGSIVTIGLEDIASTNSDNAHTFSNDKNFVIVANNGFALNTNYSGTFDLGYVQPPYTALDKTWRVTEFGDVGSVKLRLPASDITSNLSLSSNEDYILLMADDPNFTTNVSVEFLELSGSNYDATANFPPNSVKYFTFGKAPLHYNKAHVDFDGTDDYLEGNGLMVGYANATIMGWVKLNTGFSSTGVIFGQQMFNIGVNASLVPYVDIINNTSTTPVRLLSTQTIFKNIWTHVTASYNGTTGDVELYINGELIVPTTVAAGVLSTNATVNSTLQIGGMNGSYYMRGNIDELRVFNSELSQDQIQKIVYQEVEDNAGNLKGDIIPKDVENLSWSSLKAYYKLNDYKAVSVVDWVNFDKALFRNFNTSIATQIQTAPMPFETSSDGDWTNAAVWSQNTIWDVSSIDEKDWAIVKINNDVTASERHSTLGLIVGNGKTLTFNNDNELNNTWYLELNGTIDLKSDSQLIQTNTSDLVTSADGKILRCQEGASSAYWYNYYGSPVGAIGVTALADNNTGTNNINNSAFNIDMLKDGTELDIEFTSSYGEAGKLSTHWFYTFQNGVTYWNWSLFNPATPLNPGIGYIHKGTGTADLVQQYLFEGKPNNGTITIAATDTGGAGNVPNVSQTQYLVGNPYPSAISVNQFIDDNNSVISGSLSLWEQWSGSSHYLNKYNGGYATVNKTGSIRAYQFEDGILGSPTGTQNGVLTPTPYISVSQGFIVDVVADGDIVFNNNQRIFIKEANYTNSYNGGGSAFFRNANNINNKSTKVQSDEMSIIRLNFKAIDGPSRELLLGFSDSTSDDFDYGYDALNSGDLNDDDLNLSFGGEGKMMIQAYSQITSEKTVPFLFKASGNYIYEINISEISNIIDNQEIYLRDNLTNTYFNLRNDQAYNFTSEAGEFADRFDVVFQSVDTLSNEDFVNDNTLIYVDNIENMLYVKGLSNQAKQLIITNILGQTIKVYNNMNKQELVNGISISNLRSGMYVVSFLADNDQAIDKKVIIN